MQWFSRVIGWLYGTPQQEQNVHGTGANVDTRTEEQKHGDVQFAEIVASAAAVNWVAKTVAQWRKFPIFNQDGSGACVAFTMAKLLGVMRWLKDGVFVVFSMGHIYTRRSNKDSQGMVGAEAFAISAQGVTLDALAPSQNLSEDDINALKLAGFANEVAALFKLSNAVPIYLPNGDIDAVASVIQQTGKGVMVWFYFTYPEWTDTPVASVNLSGVLDTRSLRHSVTAVDFVIVNGKKALIIEDSWGVFGAYAGQRVITEDFYKARNWFAAYPMNLQKVKTEDDVTPVTKYTFVKPLEFIPWNPNTNAPADPVKNAAQLEDVKALQGALQELTDPKGLTYFPLNTTPTGYYGGLTADAVLRWGKDTHVAAWDVLDVLAGKRFGAAHIAAMNHILLNL